MKRRDMESIGWELRKQLKGIRLVPPVTFEYRFFEKDRRRDKSNTAAYLIKCFEDALQAVGLLKNDNWSGVDSWTIWFGVDKNNPRIEITIRDKEE